MQDSQERLRRLAHVATRYYLEDWKQSDIAKELGVSRPLVSRMLSEARELGVVEITVHTPGQQRQDLTEQLCVRWSLRDVVLCPDAGGDGQTNQTLALAAIDLLERLRARRVGIGWGHFIGQMVTVLEQEPRRHGPVQTICPLLGSAGIPIRNYHSNENVRLLAERLGAEPYFLNLPALAQSWEERELLCSTQLYRQTHLQGEQMDTALVNIGNYPSTPDFASVARYGDLLHRNRACGRLLNYYFNQEGEIITSDRDFAIQIPREVLSRCPRVIGLCSANTAASALEGALNTGLFTALVVREGLAEELLRGRG